jgi:uncharacterized repeat protein (TIGR03803 family)
VGGMLYGTTAQGGTGACILNRTTVGCGTIFSVTPAGVETVVYSFKGGSDGFNPEAPLINVGGTLYGTTAQGGPNCGVNGCGTLFSFTPAGAKMVVYAFRGGNDGSDPHGALIYLGRRLYGTTVEGGGSNYCGAAGCGTVYSVRP